MLRLRSWLSCFLELSVPDASRADGLALAGSSVSSSAWQRKGPTPHLTPVHVLGQRLMTNSGRPRLSRHDRCTIARVELRQLTYFVAVAEELHFGRAAERLHLAGPSLSQQISNLERELGTQLLVRDRRHVELTPAGSQFLTDAREVLGAAARAFDRARKGGGELPVRLGYVSWLPPEGSTSGSSPHTRR